jgi:hypothetical protein
MAPYFQKRLGPKAEYRERQKQRVIKSPTLANQFPKLKSLTVTLEHQNADALNRRSHLKYTVNLANAKSVIRFACPNSECIRGDFDLTEEVAAAVGKRRTSVAGELACQGTTINKVRCANMLHYKLLLGY